MKSSLCHVCYVTEWLTMVSVIPLALFIRSNEVWTKTITSFFPEHIKHNSGSRAADYLSNLSAIMRLSSASHQMILLSCLLLLLSVFTSGSEYTFTATYCKFTWTLNTLRIIMAIKRKLILYQIQRKGLLGLLNINLTQLT